MLFFSGVVIIDCAYCKPLHIVQYSAPRGVALPDSA